MPTVSPAPSSLPLVSALPASGGGLAAEAGNRFSDAFEAARQAQPESAAQGMRPPKGAGDTEKATARSPDSQRPAGGARAPEAANGADEAREPVNPEEADGDEAGDPGIPPWLPWTAEALAAEAAPDGRRWADVAAQSLTAEAVATDAKRAGATTGRAEDDTEGAGRGVALADAAERAALQAGSAPAGDWAGAGDAGPSQGKAEPRTDAAIGLTGFGQALAAADTTAGGGTLAAAAAPSPTVPAGQAGTPAGTNDAPTRQVAAHVQSPAFGSALGAQLNLMVRDGVTEARLHLNPAEMGPISVQIRVVGQQARVEMMAEQAATRQALEQAMPALAGALRDSGLTLSGGGVFEQRDPRQGAPDDSGRRQARDGQAAGDARVLSDDGMIGVRARPAATPRGMVDLYA